MHRRVLERLCEPTSDNPFCLVLTDVCVLRTQGRAGPIVIGVGAGAAGAAEGQGGWGHRWSARSQCGFAAVAVMALCFATAVVCALCLAGASAFAHIWHNKLRV